MADEVPCARFQIWVWRRDTPALFKLLLTTDLDNFYSVGNRTLGR